MPYGIYLICHVSYMSSIEHAIYGIVNFSLGFDVLLDIWAFQKKTLLLSFEKGAPWKQVSSFLWQCFNALNSRADVERKECNNILAKLLQILLTFRDVGRWNQTVRGTILSKGHLKDSILEYKWIYSSQLWITSFVKLFCWITLQGPRPGLSSDMENSEQDTPGQHLKLWKKNTNSDTRKYNYKQKDLTISWLRGERGTVGVI